MEYPVFLHQPLRLLSVHMSNLVTNISMSCASLQIDQTLSYVHSYSSSHEMIMADIIVLWYRDGRYRNFPLSIIAELIATIMAIIAIPTAKFRKEVFALLQYTVW